MSAVGVVNSKINQVQTNSVVLSDVTDAMRASMLSTLVLVETMPIVGPFATALKLGLSVCDQYKCNKEAFKQLKARLYRIAELCFGDEGILMILDKRPDNHVLKPIVDKMVKDFEDSIAEIASYSKSGFFSKLLKGSKLQNAFNALDSSITQSLNELSTALQVTQLNEQAQTYDVVCDIQSKVDSLGGLQAIYEHNDLLDSVANDIGCNVNDLREELRDKLGRIEATVDDIKAINMNNSDKLDEMKSQLDVITVRLQHQAESTNVETLYIVDKNESEDSEDGSHILGRGAFGVTKKMRNTVDNRLYAVKVIRVKEAEFNGITKDQLSREASILQQLNHAHIVRYFTCYFSRRDKYFNLVMELVSGGTIASKIGDSSATLESIVKWWNQLADVLCYLHYDMNIQHRDIKPENILLSGCGNKIKIIDLGMASIVKSNASKMTKVGTSTYYSYEKASDIPYDGRDDVWAAGCVMAELMTKSRLKDRGGAIYMFHNEIVNQRRLKLISDCVTVDDHYGKIVGRMLESKQENRCNSKELTELLVQTTKKNQTFNVSTIVNPNVNSTLSSIDVVSRNDLRYNSVDKADNSHVKLELGSKKLDANSDKLDEIAVLLRNQVISAAGGTFIDSLYINDPPVIDRYDERSVLGSGSFGTIYRMRNSIDNMVCAVKVISIRKALEAGIEKEVLMREARTLQKLNHAHIVRYFTCYYSRGESLFNIVMELIEEGKLVDKIKDASVGMNDIVIWLRQMASTLNYLHNEMRVQHRDIKPENLMLSGPNESLKLIDFGLACVCQSSAGGGKVSKVGTATYSSYEKANDISYDGRDDVWAAGCVFAELLMKSRLSERGGAIYQYVVPEVNARRLSVIGECKKVCGSVELGTIITAMLESEQENRITSSELHSRMIAYDYNSFSSVQRTTASSVSTIQTSNIKAVSSVSPDKALSVTPNVSTNSNAASRNVSSFFGLFGGFGRTNNWRESKTIRGLTNCVSSVHISPDGRFIASGSNDKTVKLYDNNGKFVKIFSGYSDKITSVCFSSDSTLAVGLHDGKITLINVESEQEIRRFQCCSVSCMSFSADGSKLVAGTESYMIVFDINVGKQLFKTTDDKYYYSVSFSSEYSMIVAGCGHHGVELWKATSKKLIRTIQNKDIVGEYVYSTCFSFDGSKIVAGGSNNKITVWDTATGSLLMTLIGHSNEISGVVMSKDGSMIVSGSDDKTINVWNAATGDLIRSLEGHTDCLHSVCLGCNDTLIVSGSKDSVKLWRKNN